MSKLAIVDSESVSALGLRVFLCCFAFDAAGRINGENYGIVWN